MDARIKMMEGNVISVRVPIKIKRYGGKKLIMLPEGAHITAPQKASKPDETLVKALAKAYYWQSNAQILYSSSDLVTFLGCHHAGFLNVKALSESMDKAEASTTAQQLLQPKGLEHEAPSSSCIAARNVLFSDLLELSDIGRELGPESE